MTRGMAVQHRFVDVIPDALEERTLYISITYSVVVHRCLCGCGDEIVTPIAPTEWRLTYDGETISFAPSVGNWSSRCKSHYWISRSEVHWSTTWSRERIEAGRRADAHEKAMGYGTHEGVTDGQRSGHGLLRSIWIYLRSLVRSR